MPVVQNEIGLRRVLRGSGASASLREVVTGMTRRLFPDRQKQHPFDRRHKVDTGGLIYPEALAWGHEHDHESAGYYATAPSMFHEAIARWSTLLAGSRYALSDYTLVDIGAGKGRVVMMASEYSFRAVVGVELNPGLVKIARRNVRKFVRKSWNGLPGIKSETSTPRTTTSPRGPRTWGAPGLQIVKGDVLEFPLPDGPVVLFFFNSFEREMVRMWLERLVEAAATRTAPIDLIYVHPEHRELFQQTPGITLLADEVMPFSEEDAAADVFGVSMDRFAIYRIDRL
jgi:hypothetical protein